MAIDLVGVFDEERVAASAVEQLRDLGIDQDNIQMHSCGTGTSMGSGKHSREHHGFFSRLFGREEHGDLSGHLAEATRRGGCVVSVHLKDESRAAEVERILNNSGTIDLHDRVNTWQASGYQGYNADLDDYTPDQIARERETLQVVQEEIRVGKRQVEAGGVRVHRRISEVPVTEQVTLREERAVVDRRPVDRMASADELREFDAGNADIEIRETREEAVVDKQARVVEEVSVGKEAIERTEQIEDTVRRSDVDVEQLGGVQQGMLNRQGSMQQPNRPL